MLRLRRWAALLGLGLLGLALAGFLAERSAAQKVKMFQPIQPPPPASTGTSAGLSSVKITEDSRLRQVINVGRDCIKDQDWKQGVEALQAVLNEKDDFYVQVHERDAFDLKKESIRWTSVKFEANNLLGAMPLAGLQTYEQTYGAEAKSMLDDAKKNGDQGLLASVAQRFCHTKAGIEANEIQATLFLARGQVFTAALRFEKLLQMNPEWAKVNDLTLFKSAIAFRRAGETKNAEDAWKRLQDNLQARPGLKIGEDMVPMAKLDEVLKESAVVDIVNQYDWPMTGGNKMRTAQAIGSPPLLDTRLWRRPLLMDKLDGFNDQDQDQLAQARVNAAIKQANDANQPVLPGFFPIASQGVMVYRSYRHICAVALKDMEVRDEESGTISKYKPGEILWKSIPLDRSLAELMQKPATGAKSAQWLDSFNQIPGFSSFLYDNTTTGALVTDHRYVYAINDVAVPPHPSVFFNPQFGFNPQMQQFQPGEMKPKLMQSGLFAYELKSGKLKWDLNPDTEDDPVFKESHFLSLPISIGGKLYVLNEKLLSTQAVAPNPWGGMGNPLGTGDSELRLICIDPNKVKGNRPEVEKPQTLGTIAQHNRFVQDISRRVNAVHLAYGEGILVCPTNAGEVFGIELMTRSLVWSYPYRESPHLVIQLPGMPNQPQPFPINPNFKNFGTTTTISKWKSSPPAIQDGKIVFTAPDADSIHCVNLRDGKPVWKKGQIKGDLYLAGVYKGKVLVVGESNVRILDLKTGSLLRTIPTGDLPSGQGVASKDVYYLPLKKGEILAIDIVNMEVKAHNRAAVAGASPGNLVFYEGMVLSQTPTEVMAYPQLSARLDAAKVDSANDPENLAKLTEYGDLLLKDGQVQIAVDTLLKVYNRNPADPLGKRVKERLFEALTDLMQVDFNKASKDYLTTYKSLCDVPGDNKQEQARKAKFYRIVGQGREAQGNLVEAFQMYKDFGALTIHRDQGGIVSPEDPTQKIPVTVWLRGRISGMLAKAKPDEREPLEAKIAEEWKAVEAKKDINAIRSFVDMFDIPVRVGREARVRLAETIMERNDRTSFLEAELLLYQVMGSEYRADPQTGGRSLAALAQLEEKKGTVDSMRLAAAYYRDLGNRFAKDAVRGKKTGADLFNELATDKRFLPFLENNSSSWGAVKVAAREIPPGSIAVPLSGFVMQPEGDQTPFARENRIMLDPSNGINPKVRLRDIAAGADRWVTDLGQVPMNQQLFFNLYQQANVNNSYHPNARYRFYHVKGHLVVAQVGVMVYCFDGDSGKKLWEMQTVENIPQNGLIHLQQVIPDQEGNPEFMYWNQLTNQRFRVTLGRIGAAQASYVAVLGYKGLTVVDPLRGTTLWKKIDVPINSHLFGDDQYLFLVEANDNGSLGAGRTLRASDGETQDVADFSGVYQSRIRVLGRHILAAKPDRQNVTLHLYDILTAKDVWSKVFAAGAQIVQTEDKSITGVVEPDGKITILDATTGNEILQTSVTVGRITTEDLKGLKDILLVHDSDQYYVALNRPIEANKVGGGVLHNNFNNGSRCLPINGWVLGIRKNDGHAKLGTRELTWKKGEAWHSSAPIASQLLVLEQFEQSPVLLFTTRKMEILPTGGNRWVSVTQSLHKLTGKNVYDSGPKVINGLSPTFSAMNIDLKSRTVNLIGFSGSIQHYVDEGKGPPPLPQGAMLNRVPDGTSNTIMVGQQGFAPPNIVPPGQVRIMRNVLPPVIQVVPAPLVPAK